MEGRNDARGMDMINLTANITFPNVNRWQVLAFDIGSGRVTLRFWAPANTSPSPPWVDVSFVLSDVADRSGGVALNPAPQSWSDKIIAVGLTPSGQGGVGAANSFTNAIAAYRGAANASAGLRAIEGQGLVDRWVSSAFAGT